MEMQLVMDDAKQKLYNKVLATFNESFHSFKLALDKTNYAKAKVDLYRATDLINNSPSDEFRKQVYDLVRSVDNGNYSAAKTSNVSQWIKNYAAVIVISYKIAARDEKKTKTIKDTFDITEKEMNFMTMLCATNEMQKGKYDSADRMMKSLDSTDKATVVNDVVVNVLANQKFPAFMKLSERYAISEAKVDEVIADLTLNLILSKQFHAEDLWFKELSLPDARACTIKDTAAERALELALINHFNSKFPNPKDIIHAYDIPPNKVLEIATRAKKQLEAKVEESIATHRKIFEDNVRRATALPGEVFEKAGLRADVINAIRD